MFLDVPGTLGVGHYEFELQVWRPGTDEVGVTTWQMDVVAAAQPTAPR